MNRSERTSRLAVDPTRCAGHGICALMAPDLIDLDRWGYPILERDPDDARRLTRQASRAVRACPRRALALDPRPAAAGSAAGPLRSTR